MITLLIPFCKQGPKICSILSFLTRWVFTKIRLRNFKHSHGGSQCAIGRPHCCSEAFQLHFETCELSPCRNSLRPKMFSGLQLGFRLQLCSNQITVARWFPLKHTETIPCPCPQHPTATPKRMFQIVLLHSCAKFLRFPLPTG